MQQQEALNALRDERGQGLVEYALIIAIVSLGAVLSLGFVSGKIDTLLSKTGNSLTSIEVAAPAGGGTQTTPGGGTGETPGGGTETTPGGETPPPVDTTSPSLAILAPAGGATNVGMNPTYSGTCGTAAGDLPTITVTVARVAGQPDNQSPYGPFTTTCTAGGTWSLVHPGPGASQGLKNNRTYLATVTQSDTAGNTATATSQFTV